MNYRPEIDGLRAIAVTSVILSHAGFEVIKAGFLGVDIFFVISGYLITLIIMNKLNNNAFSFISFYERRARRILPALFFVLSFSYLSFWFILDPSNFKLFSQSLFATSTFLSNFYFWLKVSYFAPGAEVTPLIHTWSLAIEEQFYIIFPGMMFFIWRYDFKRIFIIIFSLAFISLIASEFFFRNDIEANFYLIISRAWELLIGSIAALIIFKFELKKNSLFSLLGFILVLYSLFFLDKDLKLPGLYSLIPVLGVFLIIIYSDKDHIVTKFLSLKYLVGIGLISYSAYLWHQPLLVFFRFFFDGEIPLFYLIIIILINFIFAFLTWKFIENPFRHNDIIKKKKFIIFSIIFLILFSALGLWGHKTSGANSFAFLSIDKKFKSLASNSLQDIKNINGYSCHDEFVNKKNYLDYLCQYDFENNKNNFDQIIVWGDSHVHSFSDLFIGLAKNTNSKLIMSSLGTCPPSLNLVQNLHRYKKPNLCSQFNSQMANKTLEYSNSIIFLVGRWSNYTSKKHKYDKGDIDRFVSCKEENFEYSLNASKKCLEIGLFKLLNKINKNNSKIYILSQVPTFDFTIEDIYKIKNLNEISNTKIVEYNDQNSHMTNILNKFQFKNYLDLWKLICGNTEDCKVIKDNHLIYRDHNHVSSYLANSIINEFKSLINDINK